MVDCTALEMRHTGNRIGGSNPSLSAIAQFAVQHARFRSDAQRLAYCRDKDMAKYPDHNLRAAGWNYGIVYL